MEAEETKQTLEIFHPLSLNIIMLIAEQHIYPQVPVGRSARLVFYEGVKSGVVPIRPRWIACLLARTLDVPRRAHAQHGHHHHHHHERGGWKDGRRRATEKWAAARLAWPGLAWTGLGGYHRKKGRKWTQIIHFFYSTFILLSFYFLRADLFS